MNLIIFTFQIQVFQKLIQFHDPSNDSFLRVIDRLSFYIQPVIYLQWEKPHARNLS